MDNTSYNPFENIDSRLKAIETTLQTLAGNLSQVDKPKKSNYTIDEAAAALNVARITLYRQIQSGKIPSKRVGARIMIPGSFIEN